MWLHLQSPRFQKGSALLEQSILIYGVAVVVVATFDIARLVQGYIGVREAIDVSLRCLYTVEGPCREASQPTALPRLYDYLQVIPTTEYEVRRARYTAQGDWSEGGVYRQEARATVVDSIDFSPLGSEFVSVEQRYGDGQVEHLSLQLPYLSGSDPRNQNYSYGGVAAARIGSAVATTVDLGAVRLNAAETAARSPRFRISAPVVANGALPCLQFPDNDRGRVRECAEIWPQRWQQSAGYGNPDAPSGERWRAKKLSTEDILSSESYVVLQIDGSSIPGGGTLESAGIEIILVDEQNGKKMHLGGQIITGAPEVKNFYPRGAAPEQISAHDSFADGDLQEFSRYQAISLRYGAPYHLEFSFTRHSGNGAIGWQGDSLRIFQPRVLQKRTSIKCGDSCAATCLSELQFPPSVHPVRAPLTPQRTELGCSIDAPPLPVATCPVLLERRGVCPTERTTLSCPSNFGVSIESPTEYAKVCPPPAPIPLSAASWRTREIALPSHQWLSQGCDQVSTPPGSWQSYRKLVVDAPLKIESIMLPPQNASCELVQAHSRIFNSSCMAIAPAGKVIDAFGSWVSPLTDYAARLREDAQRCGLPSEASFDVREELHTLLLPSPPTNEPFRAVQNGANSTEKIAGGPFVEGTTPPVCRQDGVVCEMVFAGYKEVATDPTQLSKTVLQRAVELGQSRLQSVYPRARSCPNSSAADCMALEASQVGSDTVAVRGTLAVPLLMSRIVGWPGTVTLRYSASRLQEEHFADPLRASQ